MKRSRYTEEQLAYALRQVDGATPAIEICRRMGISEQTFYTWRRRYGPMSATEMCKVRVLEEEVRRLKLAMASTVSRSESTAAIYQFGRRRAHPGNDTDLAWIELWRRTGLGSRRDDIWLTEAPALRGRYKHRSIEGPIRNNLGPASG